MNLTEIRKERNLSILDLSKLTNISYRTLEEAERRKDTKVSIAVIIAQTLGVTLDELCVPKGGAKFMYKYRLVDATNRKNTNLKNYQTIITNSIKTTFSNISTLITITVYNDYFTIQSPISLPSTGLRKMGQDMANSHVDFRNMVKTYTYKRSNGQLGQSNQLFKSFQ